MITLLLLVTMGAIQAAHSTLSSQESPSAKENASIVIDMHGSSTLLSPNALHATSMDPVSRVYGYALRRTCSLSSPTSPTTPNTPVAYPKYTRRYPDPISIWTDEDIDKYYRAWGPRDYLAYAMRLYNEHYVNAYGEPHINDKGT
jgi:hypothetical protein